MAGVSGTDERHRLTALTGTVGLGLDALASVAYGPEVIVLLLAVLVAARTVTTPMHNSPTNVIV